MKTDVFNFAKLKVFEDIKDNIPDEAREICDVFEDLLFSWNFKSNNLKVVNWRSSQNKDEKDVKCQTLIPSSSPNFSISKVLVSPGGSYCSISGAQGLSIMELPSRWGSDGIYNDGKAQITCKTVNIHEHAENQLQVVQVRWHPNSPSDSHLVVLYSDNSLRIYDEGVSKHIWRVGPLPNQSNSGKVFSYLKSLGDTAIDFDIAPAQVSSESSPNSSFLDGSVSTTFSIKRSQQDQKKVEWPFVILRGNGTIFVLCAGFNTEKPRLQGPLTMIPSQKDNYGDDSCSLLVIPTLPITLVIAENTGILHHALMIEANPHEHSFDDTKTIFQNDWELYVLENIELELGFDEKKVKDTSSSPLCLKRDPINEHRYFCYHDAGLHGITIGFISQLQKFEDDDNEEDFNPNIPSRAEYILSTKAFNNSKVNSVVGFGILQLPSGIFAVMNSGQIISLSTLKTLIPLVTYAAPQAPNLDQKIIDQQLKISFDQHIKTLLKSDVSQPIFQLDKNNPPSSKQAFQLLMSSIQLMRDKQFVRHDKVRQEIMKRVKILELMKNQQKDEISALFESKEAIQEKAYKLADMHEDILERQQNFQKRLSDLSRLSSLRMPSNPANEKEFADQIKRLKGIVDKLSQDVKQVKAKNETQKKSLENWNHTNNEPNTLTLPPKQEESVKEYLSDMMRQIQALKADVLKISNVIDY